MADELPEEYWVTTACASTTHVIKTAECSWCTIEQLRGNLSLAEEGLANYQQEIERLRAALLKAKRSHYDCEDPWYQCPQHEEGCADDRRRGGPCDCGADEFNAWIDSVLSGASVPQSAEQKK